MKTSLSAAMPAPSCRLLHGRPDIAKNTCSFRGMPAGYALEGTGAKRIDTHCAPVPGQAVATLAVMRYFYTSLSFTVFPTGFSNRQDINNFLPGSFSSEKAMRPLSGLPQA